MKKIYLIRHCEASGQEPGALLTNRGADQAIKLAEFLSDKNIEMIVTSPYQRAISSIQPLAKKLGLKIHLDERLSERVLTSSPHPDWLNMLKRSFNDLELAFDGGESGKIATARGMSALTDLLESPAKTLAVVTHGNLMAFILKQYDESFGFNEWKALSNPDVFELRFCGSEIEIKRVWGI